MQFYAANLIRIEGASVGSEAFSPEKRDVFIAAVSPLVQKAVFNVCLGELTDKLSD